MSDFGLYSRRFPKRLETAEPNQGGAVYYSPETLGENPIYDPKCDIWALGCILYELVEQEPAFPDATEMMIASSRRQLLIAANGFDMRGQRIVRELINATLEVDMWKRPEASHVLQMVVPIIRWDRTLLWVHCRHRSGSNGNVNALLIPSTRMMWPYIRWSQSW